MNRGLLTHIAAAVGTPVYVYDAAVIRKTYHTLTAALGARFAHHVFYSVKANSNLALLRLLQELGAGADIVSGGELARACAAGIRPEDVVFSGVGKAAHELEAAVTAGGVLVNLESAGELEALARVVERVGCEARVGIRLNPDVSAATHGYTQTGVREAKFGVPFEELQRLGCAVYRHPQLRLTSVGMHIGSQITDPDPYRLGAERLADAVRGLREAGVDTLESVDVGGGIAIRHGEGFALDPKRFADAIAPLAEATGLDVLVEPGRCLVGNAGSLLTRVLYRKRSGGRQLAIVDGGMSDLLRPSLYQAEHPIVVVDGAEPETNGAREQVDVVGPICETGDFLGLQRSLPAAGPGALLAVLGVGAYGFTMSSNYNSRTRAAEVLVDGERWAVIRRRETYDDLMRGECPEPEWQ